ncbi:hypothetical protein CR513_10612, partial [Mucuna pruriens]
MVAPSDPKSGLLTDRSGRPFFPFQWTRQPAVSITIDLEDLESWERSFIAELKEMPVLRSVEIIKGKGYSTKALAELRKRKEHAPQQASPSVGVEAQAAPLFTAGPADLAQASQEEASRTPSVFELERNAPPSPHQADRESGGRPSKRPRLGEEVQIDNVSASLDVSAPQSSDPRLLLYKSFLRAADRTLASSSLEQEVERLGLVGVYGALQQYVAHGFALARATEKKFEDLEAERISWAEHSKNSKEENHKLSSALLEAEARLNEYRLSTAKLQEALRVEQRMNGELLDAKAELLQAKTDLELSNDSLQVEVRKLREDAAELEVAHQEELKSMGESLKATQDTIEACDKTIYQQGIDIVDQYEVGFNRAIGQFKFLHPSIDVSEADPFKEIVDGRLVSVLTPPGTTLKLLGEFPSLGADRSGGFRVTLLEVIPREPLVKRDDGIYRTYLGRVHGQLSLSCHLWTLSEAGPWPTVQVALIGLIRGESMVNFVELPSLDIIRGEPMADRVGGTYRTYPRRVHGQLC